MENREQVYSHHGEIWMNHNEIMWELRLFHNIGESVEVWEADKREWKHSDFIDVDIIIDDMQTRAMDDCGEVAEKYLNELTDWDKGDLEIHIAEWFNKNAKLDFYGVENEHKIVVVVE